MHCAIGDIDLSGFELIVQRRALINRLPLWINPTDHVRSLPTIDDHLASEILTKHILDLV